MRFWEKPSAIAKKKKKKIPTLLCTLMRFSPASNQLSKHSTAHGVTFGLRVSDPDPPFFKLEPDPDSYYSEKLDQDSDPHSCQNSEAFWGSKLSRGGPWTLKMEAQWGPRRSVGLTLMRSRIWVRIRICIEKKAGSGSVSALKWKAWSGFASAWKWADPKPCFLSSLKYFSNFTIE